MHHDKNSNQTTPAITRRVPVRLGEECEGGFHRDVFNQGREFSSLSSVVESSAKLTMLAKKMTADSFNPPFHLTQHSEFSLGKGFIPNGEQGAVGEFNRARVLSYFDHPISSGIMEGINNKIGRLTRKAYGYRDVDFLHLRIYALHD